jgi:ribose transport system substrate-binding protein
MAGAHEAAERAGRAAGTIFVAIDGYNGLLKLIRAGKVAATALFPAGLGAEALLAGLKILHGEQVPKRVKLPNIRVTHDNVDAYVGPSLPDDAWTY